MFSRKLKSMWILPDYRFQYRLETRPRFFRRFVRAHNPFEWSSAQCWVNLGWLRASLESLALLWIRNQVKCGSFYRITFILFCHTSILKIKVWPVKIQSSKEKKLCTNSLDEMRSNISFCINTITKYLWIKLLNNSVTEKCNLDFFHLNFTSFT